jgi:hypothetical protein
MGGTGIFALSLAAMGDGSAPTRMLPTTILADMLHMMMTALRLVQPIPTNDHIHHTPTVTPTMRAPDLQPEATDVNSSIRTSVGLDLVPLLMAISPILQVLVTSGFPGRPPSLQHQLLNFPS